MYMDNFTRGLMLGDDAGVSRIDSGNFGRYRRLITATPGRKTRKRVGPHTPHVPIHRDFRQNTPERQVARAFGAGSRTMANRLAMRGIGMKSMVDPQAPAALGADFPGDDKFYLQGGFNYPAGVNKMYLHGDEYMGGWLTDLTKPVSKVVRSASSAVLGVGRTAIRATAPALVSAITGRPVDVRTGAELQQTQVQSPNNTMLMLGVGGAALLAVLLMTRKK